MTTTQDHQRPGGVTFIVVVAIINAIFSIAGGILIIVNNDNRRLLHESGLTKNQLAGSGWAILIVGAIGLILALALGHGSRLARFLFGIWAVLQFAGGVYAVVALHGQQRGTGAVSAAIGVIVLYLLYGSEKDREYFLHH